MKFPTQFGHFSLNLRISLGGQRLKNIKTGIEVPTYILVSVTTGLDSVCSNK